MAITSCWVKNLILSPEVKSPPNTVWKLVKATTGVPTAALTGTVPCKVEAGRNASVCNPGPEKSCFLWASHPLVPLQCHYNIINCSVSSGELLPALALLYTLKMSWENLLSGRQLGLLSFLMQKRNCNGEVKRMGFKGGLWTPIYQQEE